MAPKIWDCTIFYQEFDMLELRLNILNDVVDRFVVCEAGETHSGKPKPAYFAENRARFARWANKIEYVYVPSLTEIAGDDSWRRERAHRDAIKLGLYSKIISTDWVIVGDVDEIPDPVCVQKLKGVSEDIISAQFELAFYYYTFNHRVQQGWAIGAIRGRLAYDPNKTRTCSVTDARPEIHVTFNPGGWHFSYFMSPEKVADKLDAFMHHADVAADVPRDPAWLGEQMSAGADIFGRGLPIEYQPTSDTLPAYVLANADQYRQMGWLE